MGMVCRLPPNVLIVDVCFMGVMNGLKWKNDGDAGLLSVLSLSSSYRPSRPMAASCRPLGMNMTSRTSAAVAPRPSAKHPSWSPGCVAHSPATAHPTHRGAVQPTASPMYMASR